MTTWNATPWSPSARPNRPTNSQTSHSARVGLGTNSATSARQRSWIRIAEPKTMPTRLTYGRCSTTDTAASGEMNCPRLWTARRMVPPLAFPASSLAKWGRKVGALMSRRPV
jgi:hypothetical protein